MLFKRVTIFLSMLAFIYTIAFGIFLTDLVRIPAPLIFGLLPLFFATSPLSGFAYHKELILSSLALFLYCIVGNNDFKSFGASMITITSCLCYFNYFVGTSGFRYRLSIAIFVCLLATSMVLMLFDHFDANLIDPIRELSVGEPVKQSPSGIATTQFTFGYQLAAFCTFSVVGVVSHRRSIFIIIAVCLFCLLCMFFGMNRSAFLVFFVTTGLFIIGYYRWKAIAIIGLILLLSIGIYQVILKENINNKNNILSKNQAKQANDFNRATMSIENLKIMAEYPYGLIFYGKTWKQATYRNPLFVDGLSSHNAYLMFITYLGPFIGLGLLAAIYLHIFKLFWSNLRMIKRRKYALFTSILFSFIAVSLNAFSHNGWLLSVDGPTLFLYIAILHYHKVYFTKKTVPIGNESVQKLKPNIKFFAFTK
ncbi:MAG: hypothetical protein EOP00_00305 [Pedobacter sp.]|nr:MAG: hypothetical protein EOP00_00305 [Pedobacter sp.]